MPADHDASLLARRRAQSVLLTAALLGVVFAGAHCSGGSKAPVGTYLASSATAGDGGAPKKPRPPTGPLEIPKALPTHGVAIVPDKSIGPYFARRNDRGVAVYVAPTEPNARQVIAVPLTARGEPKGQARVVAAAPGETNALLVRATGGEGAGFVAAITALTDKGEALSVVGIADDGASRGAPAEIARGADDIVWTEILPTPRGAVCLWTVETKDGTANVLAVPLDPSGKPRTMPSYVARGVVGWQAVTTSRGPALAVVTSSGRPHAKGGTLSLLTLDSDGRALGAPLVVTTEPTVGGDFDVVRSGDELVFAWTDRSGLDPALTVVKLDASFAPGKPVHPLPPLGGSELTGLAGGKAGTLLAWDEPGKRAHAHRRVHFARLSGDAAESGPTLELQGEGPPELAATDDGFAVLARARACIVRESEPSCARTPPMPTVVRLDAKLSPTSVEALRLPDLEPSALAWGLDCSTTPCVALVSASGAPMPVSLVELAARPSAYRLPASGVPDPAAPRALSMVTLAVGEPYAEIATARVATSTLLALITSAVDDPSTPHRGPGSGAKLTVREVDAQGHAAKEETLTTRALSVGGVAIASAEKPEDGAALAWVAREGGDPQVHLTRLDRHGKKTGDVLVTTQPGDASDVALAAVPGGWLVAWVDTRDGNGEVYVARVSKDLRVAPHERVTKAPGDASDLALLVRGEVGWLAWADPRESPSDGFADIYVARVRTTDGHRLGDDARVLATAAHSRSPVLAPAGAGVAVGWIEEAASGSESANNATQGAMVAWLDANGRPLQEPTRVLGAGEGVPSAIALAPATGDALRAVLVRATREELVLDALDLGPTTPPRVSPLVALLGPPTLDVSLVLDGDLLYYTDGGPEASDDRARRLSLAWRGAK